MGQVCIAIRSRNLANEQDHAEKDPDFCKSVLAENIRNTVDGQSQQQGPLGEDTDKHNLASSLITNRSYHTILAGKMAS